MPKQQSQPIRNSISNIPTNQPIRLQIAPQYCKIIQIKNQQLRNQPSKQYLIKSQIALLAKIITSQVNNTYFYLSSMEKAAAMSIWLKNKTEKYKGRSIGEIHRCKGIIAQLPSTNCSWINRAHDTMLTIQREKEARVFHYNKQKDIYEIRVTIEYIN
jgi:hypothetical protein